MGEQIELDKNGGITYVQVIDSLNKTKEQLYVLLNYWFTTSFNDANSVIKLNDKQVGCIIGEGYLPNIAYYTGVFYSFRVDIKPVIKCDIKDNKVRVTYTVPTYHIVSNSGGGVVSILAGSQSNYRIEQWDISKCYPFVEKSTNHRTVAAKALVMSYAFSNVIMDKIEECVKHGIVGNETDEW